MNITLFHGTTLPSRPSDPRIDSFLLSVLGPEIIMSTLDQPLLIANSNYHVGQQVAIYVAEEQGFFQEEGFTSYDYDGRGLIAGPLERDGLALVIDEHGVDVATAVNVGTALFQRLQGVDLKVVGGWRYAPDYKFYAVKHITAIQQLRGCRIGLRETGCSVKFLLPMCFAGLD